MRHVRLVSGTLLINSRMSVPRMRRVAPFDPTQAGGCVLWLDGQDPAGTGIAPANSATVSTWKDKSGSGNNATGGSAATFTTSAINGRAALSFNGSSTYYDSQDLYSNRSFSIFMVIRRQGSIPGFTGLLCGSSSSSNQNLTLAFRNNNDITLGFYYNDLDYTSFPDYTANISTEPAYLVEGTYTPGSRVIYLNGTQVASDTNSTNLGSDPGANIGGNSGQRFNGFIGELIILNAIPAASSRIQIEGYLAQKWGLKSSLPGGHPGIITTIYPTPRTLSMTPRQYPASYNPTTVAGCCLWLDGADSTSTSAITSGTWYDKSSFASNATAYAGGSSFSMGSINGLSAVTFSSAANAFVANTTLSTSGFSIFFVVRITSLSGNGTRFVMSGVGYGLQIYALSASFPFQLGTYVNNVFPSNNTSISQNAIFIYSVTIGPSLFYQWINGVANSSSGSGNLSLSSIYIGNVNGPTDSTLAFVGQMGEFLVYNSSLTDPQRQTIEGYLASKWGLQSSLPSDHPYKSASPNITNPLGISRQALPSALFPTPKTNTGFAPNLSIPSYTITNGLVSFFLFNNTIADFQNTITFAQTGSISYVTGLRNQALSLTNTSGVTNYLTSTYSFPSTFTVSMWFQSPSTSPNSMVFCAANTIARVNGSVTIYYEAGSLYCAYSDVVNNGTGYGISANTWYHALLTYNSGTTTLYVNGSQSGSAISGTNSKSGFTLGGGADSGRSYPFTGYIDDLRIYSRVLSGSEITAIYNGTG